MWIPWDAILAVGFASNGTESMPALDVDPDLVEEWFATQIRTEAEGTEEEKANGYAVALPRNLSISTDDLHSLLTTDWLHRSRAARR